MFFPNKKRDHSGDYYKVFNNENSASSFKSQLLTNLHESFIIILENARYNKWYSKNIPKVLKLKKNVVLKALSDYLLSTTKIIQK